MVLFFTLFTFLENAFDEIRIKVGILMTTFCPLEKKVLLENPCVKSYFCMTFKNMIGAYEEKRIGRLDEKEGVSTFMTSLI